MPQQRSRYDPWGPISALLFGIGDSDFVLNAVGMTGVDFKWQPLSDREAFSHGTRIRAYRPLIDAAYGTLPDEQKGRFAQIVLKAMLSRHDSPELRARLEQSLADIGWRISPEGNLYTEDAIVGEQFFEPNSRFDAYVAIRGVLGRAR